MGAVIAMQTRFTLFPKRRIVNHFVPNSPLRVSSLRSLGAYANIFAIESFMDELAQASGVDPLEFRLRHLQDARAPGCTPGGGGSGASGRHKRTLKQPGRGRGLAFAQYKNQKCLCRGGDRDFWLMKTSGVIGLERAHHCR